MPAVIAAAVAAATEIFLQRMMTSRFRFELTGDASFSLRLPGEPACPARSNYRIGARNGAS
jgi:hypothetical protein